MKLKKVSKYMLSEMKNSILIFYLVILFITIFFSVSASDGNTSFNGMEMASSIFLFVLGLNSFKTNYLFLLSNGIPRRTQFRGFFLAAISVAAGIAVINRIFEALFTRVINYNNMFDMIYKQVTQSPVNSTISILWSITVSMFAITLGYFITLAYYRMAKTLKIIISIGVPAFFFVILPYFAFKWSSIETINRVESTIRTLFGVNGEYRPMNAVVTFLVLTVVLSALSYLLIRKAPVKEN